MVTSFGFSKSMRLAMNHVIRCILIGGISVLASYGASSDERLGGGAGRSAA